VDRVTQEALTNVRKHAPGQIVTIAIDGDGRTEVRVEIVNGPRVGQARVTDTEAPGADGSPDGDHVGSGMGLVGLAERVTLVGGRLTSEALPGGGFRLMATLPCTDADAEDPAK
jgi:signal transduction histidine kinase